MDKIINVLSTEQLSIGYKSRSKITEVAHNINISLQDASLYSVIGVNGSGKSTFLKTIAGLIPTLSGDVFCYENNIKNMSARDLSSLVSCVFTGFPDLGLMRVFDVISLGRYLYTGFTGRLSVDDQDVVNGIISILDIEDLSDKYFFQLSDGQKQKVMIGRALAQQSKIILLDEPTAFLDFQNRVAIDLLLRQLVDNLGLTVVVSTHDINNALKISDKVLLFSSDLRVQTLNPKKEEGLSLIERTFANQNIIFNRSDTSFSIKL
ncbi:MAG: ABC transporter ATP-binding protein [Spirochaetales bacterium]|nr:ABC transporter ATP-binding protein [Spirochaetales bacterium]